MGERGRSAISMSSLHMCTLTHTRSHMYTHRHTQTHATCSVSPWLSLSRWNLLSESGVTWAGGLWKFPDRNISGYSSYSVQLQPNVKIPSSLSAENYFTLYNMLISPGNKRTGNTTVKMIKEETFSKSYLIRCLPLLLFAVCSNTTLPSGLPIVLINSG